MEKLDTLSVRRGVAPVRRPWTDEEKAVRLAKRAETRARNKKQREEARAREHENETRRFAELKAWRLPFIDEHAVRALLDVSKAELRRLREIGQLSFLKDYGRGIFSRSAVENFKARRDTLRGQMLEIARAASAVPSLFQLSVEARVPADSRFAQVLESDRLSPAELDEAAVETVAARFQCHPRYELRRPRFNGGCRGDSQYVHPGWVYALRCTGSGLIKIGRTDSKNPWHRLQTLLTMSGSPLRLLGLAHGAHFEERLHQLYAASRRHGEWFALHENPLPNRRECATCRMARWDQCGPWDPYALDFA